MKPNITVLVRSMMPQVLEIEGLCFPEGARWAESDFRRVIRDMDHIGFVVEMHETVVGYIVYGLRPNMYELVRMALHPDYRDRGIGEMLLGRVYKKAAATRRELIVVRVHESDLKMHLFFKRCGYHATKVVGEEYLFEKVVPLDDRLGTVELAETIEGA